MHNYRIPTNDVLTFIYGSMQVHRIERVLALSLSFYTTHTHQDKNCNHDPYSVWGERETEEQKYDKLDPTKSKEFQSK